VKLSARCAMRDAARAYLRHETVSQEQRSVFRGAKQSYTSQRWQIRVRVKWGRG
jgi:hypothetical protein